ncbi:MAG TPA: hypothetical protein VFF73_34515 [Planctomycetota bacterium]|nr:hypothetical protein [Planctomycetota bacterium]
MRRFWATALVAVALAAPKTARAELAAGTIPPSLGNFEVVQGDPFTDLKGLKGRVVQLVFFATW